jgi:hypothetical protein
MTQEQRTARLTVLMDPDKKSVFERLCDLDDVTPSQVIRRMVREYIEQRVGRAWQPGQTVEDFFANASIAAPILQGDREVATIGS